MQNKPETIAVESEQFTRLLHELCWLYCTKRGHEFQRELMFVMVITLLDMAGWLHL